MIIRSDTGYKFECIRCDYCCGTGPNVSLTSFDVVRMSRRTGLHWSSFLRYYTNVIVADLIPVITLAGYGKGRCPFLRFTEKGETYCTIYDARPLKCRIYPLHLVSLDTSELVLDEKCPGVGKDGFKKPPLMLIKQYSLELKEHYKKLYTRIIINNEKPLTALYQVVDELWKNAEHNNPEWASLEYLKRLELDHS